MMRRLREVLLWAGAALGLVAIATGVMVAFLGFNLLAFRSGSMAPDIPTGALALARDVPAADVSRGDVVSVVASGGERITHRVVSSTMRGDEASLVLKGDANSVEDAEIYQVASVERVVFSLPYGGYVLAHALTPPGLVAVGSLALMLVVVGFTPAPGEKRQTPRAPQTPGRHAGARRAGRRRAVATTAALAVVATGLALTSGSGGVVGGTWARFTDQATLRTGSFDAARYFTCDAAVTGVASPYLYWKFDETQQALLTSTTAADSSGNSRPGQYQAGVLTGLGLGQERACLRDSGTALQLNGSNQYVATNSTTAVAGPNVFSAAIWFKTSTAGGKIFGFGNVRTGSSGSYDRHLYMTSAGRVVFGVYPGETRTVSSGAGLANGSWHLAVATLGANGARLYVDGAEVGTPLTGTTTGQSYNGFWRVGYDNLGGWADAVGTYFAGTVDDFAVYNTQLGATAISDMWVAGRRG